MTIKVMHVGDIHLGMTKLNLDRTNEENHILNYIVNKSSEIKPDIIIVNGDITDHPIPTGELLLSKIIKFFVELKGNCDKLIINHGNHDWPGLSSIKAFEGLIGIHYITEPTQIYYKDVIFDVVPYIDIRKQFKNSTEPLKDAEKSFVKMLYDFYSKTIDENKKRVFVNHGSIKGVLEVDENFDREIQIEPSVLKEYYDLAIMSHIHSRSCIEDFIWYAGAPMTCTFGEKDYPTGFLVHEIGSKIKTKIYNTPAIQFETIEFFDESFDKIKDDIKTCISNYPNKYFKVIINCMVPTYAKHEIKKISNNIISIQLKKQENEEIKINKKAAVEKKDFSTLFKAYLSSQKGDTTKILEKFNKILEEL